MYSHVFSPTAAHALDHSDQLAEALVRAAGSVLFVPDGKYYISGVEMPSDTHLLCESPMVRFTKPRGFSDALMSEGLLTVSRREAQSVRITGGTWYSTPVVFSQSIRDPVLHDSLFEHMTLSDVGLGFRLTASRSIRFSDLRFNRVGRLGEGGGILFTGDACSSFNFITNCSFIHMAGPAISALNSSRQPTSSLHVQACRFEGGKARTAIYVEGPALSVHVDGCYFERAACNEVESGICGEKEHADIVLNAERTSICLSTIERCTFQFVRFRYCPCHVKVIGDVGVDLRHNHVHLHTIQYRDEDNKIKYMTGQYFVRTEAGSRRPSIPPSLQAQAMVLNRNRVEAIYGAKKKYGERLLDRDVADRDRRVRIVTWPGSNPRTGSDAIVTIDLP